MERIKTPVRIVESKAWKLFLIVTQDDDVIMQMDARRHSMELALLVAGLLNKELEKDNITEACNNATN